ncbi:hypothetical protein MNBD_GAMMA06-1196 [hydrothermal vent metagenome]|uniref:Uncharacterized protein n=1 Tax=hydrothermal vent metagenome TaxID=652676 RepID=A0A3B0X424_9ZZZZ
MNIRSTHTILADETVSVSDLKKSPSQYFTDHAIAVLSNNRPAGYVIGASAYEALVSMLSQCQQGETFFGEFRPTASRMREITTKGMELLQNAPTDDLEKLGNYTK